MHGMMAALLRTPIMLLNPAEADMMTSALCDVLDYHKINITEAQGPWGLYVALGVACYTIYGPRLKAIKQGRNGPTIEQPAASVSPEEQAFRQAMNGGGGMDFTGDITPAQVSPEAETFQTMQ